jgi:cell division protein FtsA
MVGEMREDGTVMITGAGNVLSAGVRKGQIIDVENAVSCAKRALEQAESTSAVNLGAVYVSVCGGHIRGACNSGSLPILDPDSGVSEDDIDEVAELAKAYNVPDGRQIIHTIHRFFSVDDQENIINPVGMVGRKLTLDVLVLHGSTSQLKNVSHVIEQLQFDVRDTAFSGLCSALAVLTPEQKKSGAVVIDLGGGTTDYMAYTDGVASCAGSLGVGGDHVTNDIAVAFNISIARAGKIKEKIGSAVVQTSVEPARVPLPAEAGFAERSLPVKSLQIVINARMKEIFEMVRKALDNDGVLSKIGAGVILTGGGAHLDGVVELASRVFGVPCFVGTPRGITGLATVTDGPEYATCCGLIQYGFRVQDEFEPDNRSLLSSIFDTLLGRRG